MSASHKGFDDQDFAAPFIDADEWRELPVRHRYIHGGFANNTSRFCMYFPEPAAYKDRFFQLMTPVQAPETLGQGAEGEDDWIGFSLTHGAAYIMTNLGGSVNGGGDPSLAVRCAAGCAQYYRRLADEMYGERHHYGYVFGGSGGSFKTISAIETTDGVWDGAVPFVMGSPMAIPNMFTVRAHAMRILRSHLAEVKDAVEPGGSGDPYRSLNEEQRAALLEAEQMGFPMKTWCEYDSIGAGALPVLFPIIRMLDPGYFRDFWEADGYLGADPDGSAVRDRICFETRIGGLLLADGTVRGGIEEAEAAEDHTAEMQKGSYGVDEAWKNMFTSADGLPLIRLCDFPHSGDPYTEGLEMHVLSGELAGESYGITWLGGNRIAAKQDVSGRNLMEQLGRMQPGDEVRLDNSDYIAIQTYHRHQYPGPDYAGWEQFVKEDHTLKYPQRPVLTGPMVAFGGAGSVQNGMPHCRIIVLESMMDESALPWQADWYRKLVMKNHDSDGNEIMRLWYMDNCMHTDCEEGNGGDHQHIVSYIGALHQAILSASDWVQKGTEPAETSGYRISRAQVLLEETAKDRKGIQPIVKLEIDADKPAVPWKARVNEEVAFRAEIDMPAGSGDLEEVEWCFEGEDRFISCGHRSETKRHPDGTGTSRAYAVHTFTEPGTYFPVVRVASNRTVGDPYTKIRNLARVRVIVED